MSLIVSHETAGLKIDIFNLISRKTRIPESFGQYSTSVKIACYDVKCHCWCISF